MQKAPRSLKASTRKGPAPAGSETPVVGAMTAEETAQYVAEFSAELAFLARRAKLDLLVYLLDMARLEAMRAMTAGLRGRQGSSAGE